MGKRLLFVAVLCLFAWTAVAQNRIIYTRPDGGVSIIVPAPNFLARFDTLAKGMAAVQTRTVPPDATDIQIINSDDVLSDRTFRNAWKQSSGVISVDMFIARTIHAERIAIAQAAEIARLKVAERKERLKGKTTQANAHAATITALEALDLNVLATQISNAPNPVALSAIWPAQVPK